jgi:TonB family protein
LKRLSAALAVATLALGQQVESGRQAEGQKHALQTGIDQTAADYSEEARIAELEGTVRVAGTVGEDGHPQDLHIVEALGLGLDEQALEIAMQQAYGPLALGLTANIEVRYHLLSKYSRWHLIHAEFQPPEGASRPQFVSASYPNGAGILSRAAVEEGLVLGAIGREGTAAIAFIIDERGVATGFRIVNASENVWGQEAIALLSEWRFKPGTKDGHPVSVPAKFELAWGPRELDPDRIARLLAALDPAYNPPSAPQRAPAAPKPVGIEIVHQVQPSYSQEALEANLQGAVLVSLVTQEDGTPTDLRVVEGLGKGLDEKALEALSQWRFKPVFSNGVFVPQQVTLQVDFKLKK